MIDEAIAAAEELASIAALDLTSDTRIIQPAQPPRTHPDIEAPDFAEFPLPCSHSFHLLYMEMSLLFCSNIQKRSLSAYYSFHQFLLGPITAARLSVVTP